MTTKTNKAQVICFILVIVTHIEYRILISTQSTQEINHQAYSIYLRALDLAAAAFHPLIIKNPLVIPLFRSQPYNHKD